MNMRRFHLKVRWVQFNEQLSLPLILLGVLQALSFALLAVLMTCVQPAYAKQVSIDRKHIEGMVYQSLLLCERRAYEAKSLSNDLSTKPDHPLVLAINLINLGQFEKALSELHRITERERYAREILILRVICHDALTESEDNSNDVQGSETFLQARVHSLRSMDLAKLGKLDLARNEILAAEHLKCEDDWLFEQAKGALSFANDQPDIALTHFLRAIELENTFADAHAKAAYCYFQMGKNSAAISEFNKALHLNQANPFLFTARGLVLMEEHKFKKAIKDFDAALSLSHDYQSAHEYKGDCYLELKRWKDAKEQYSLSRKTNCDKAAVGIGNLSAQEHSSKAQISVLSADDGCRNIVMESLSSVPISILNQLANYKVQALVHPRIRDYLKTLPEEDLPEGIFHESLVGLYLPKVRIIVIEATALSNSYEERKNEARKLVLHEVGHAYDHCRGLISRSLSFKVCFCTDMENMTKAQNVRYKRISAGGLNGCSEIFARLFATKYRVHSQEEELEKHLFTNCNNFLKKFLDK